MKNCKKIILSLLVFIFFLETVSVFQNSFVYSQNAINNINVKNKSNEGIQVEVYKNKKGIIYGFIISGHSGYAPKGSDIICSAVSALSVNCVYSIKQFTKDKIDLKVGEEGYLKCIVPKLANGSASKETVVLLKSCIFGIDNIRQSYGDKYIKIYYLNK
jgi:uncharacterized protein YsxB (DUF464 family)